MWPLSASTAPTEPGSASSSASTQGPPSRPLPRPFAESGERAGRPSRRSLPRAGAGGRGPHGVVRAGGDVSPGGVVAVTVRRLLADLNPENGDARLVGRADHRDRAVVRGARIARHEPPLVVLDVDGA